MTVALEDRPTPPGCCGKFTVDESITLDDAAGQYSLAKNKAHSMTVAEPCSCFSCFCWSYKGFCFSASNIWLCGKGRFQGPCVWGSFPSPDTVHISWMGCPAEEYKRDRIISAIAPTNERIARSERRRSSRSSGSGGADVPTTTEV